MIAHILDDLPLALADTLPVDDARARRDYLRIMRVVHDAIDRIQDRVALRYAPGLALLDRLALRGDEWLTLLGVWAHRRVALAEASRLVQGGEVRARARARIEQRALLAARVVRSSPP